MAGSELGLFEWYVAVTAYYVDLPRGSNDGSAMWADVLDAAILAGAAPAFDGRSRFAALVIVGFGFDLERRFAAGGYILHAGLLGQPFGGFFGQRRDRPAISGVVLDVQAVCFGGFLEFLIVVVPVVADVLDLIGQVVEMCHFVEHGRCHLADGPVDVFGANVDLPVRLAAGLPDFIHAAPAVGSAPAVRRYGDGRAGKLVIIEVMVEKVEHGLGLGYDFRYAQHCCGLPCFDVVTTYPFEHIFQVGKGDKDAKPTRFQRLQRAHPKLWRYCMKDWETGGLGMKTLRSSGSVAHIHDELIIECDPAVSLEAVCEQMGRTPPWTPGLILRADGDEMKYYQKA